MALNRTKKELLRKWVKNVGGDKAIKSLSTEHDRAFLNMGIDGGEYLPKEMDRVEEMAESINYIKFLNKFGKDLPI